MKKAFSFVVALSLLMMLFVGAFGVSADSDTYAFPIAEEPDHPFGALPLWEKTETGFKIAPEGEQRMVTFDLPAWNLNEQAYLNIRFNGAVYGGFTYYIYVYNADGSGPIDVLFGAQQAMDGDVQFDLTAASAAKAGGAYSTGYLLKLAISADPYGAYFGWDYVTEVTHLYLAKTLDAEPPVGEDPAPDPGPDPDPDPVVPVDPIIVNPADGYVEDLVMVFTPGEGGFTMKIDPDQFGAYNNQGSVKFKMGSPDYSKYKYLHFELKEMKHPIYLTWYMCDANYNLVDAVGLPAYTDAGKYTIDIEAAVRNKNEAYLNGYNFILMLTMDDGKSASGDVNTVGKIYLDNVADWTANDNNEQNKPLGVELEITLAIVMIVAAMGALVATRIKAR